MSGKQLGAVMYALVLFVACAAHNIPPSENSANDEYVRLLHTISDMYRESLVSRLAGNALTIRREAKRNGDLINTILAMGLPKDMLAAGR